jgi:hypothetical protein
MNVVYVPPWGGRAVLAMALVWVAMMLAQMWRERRVTSWKGCAGPAALRLMFVAAAVMVLLNPVALLPRQQPGKPKLVLLVDTSASMATRDVDGAARGEAVLRTLSGGGTREMLEREFELDLRRFDRQWRPVDWETLWSEPPSGEGTDLASAITAAVGDLAGEKSPAGVLVVSDGRATTEGATQSARLALAQSVPLWTWCVGGEVVRRDVWVEVASPEVLAFANAQIELGATLRQTGLADRSFRVELLKDDVVIESREVVPDGSGAARIRVPVRAPASGEHRYVFRVPADPLEVDPHNNERPVYVRVVGEKVRVLLAEGQPHWDTKFLVQALARSPQVDLTAVYRIGGGRNFSVVSSEGHEHRLEGDLFPRTESEWMGYDVVILGRGCEVFFDEDTEALLTGFVARRGGSLVFARGKAYGGRFAPLAKFEPVVWAEGADHQLQVTLTDAGRETPMFEWGVEAGPEELLAKLPALDQATITAGEKPLALVLATARGAATASPHSGTAIIAYQRFGQGRVLTLNATGFWRWAFGDPQRADTETVYTGFWLSLMRWLLSGTDFLPGADVALRSAQRTYTAGQRMQFLIATRGLDPETYRPRLVISGLQDDIEVEPRFSRTEGGYVAEAGPFAPGRYTVTLHNNIGAPGELTQTIEVVSASVENQVLSADPETMAKLAEISGGAVLSARDVANFAEVVRRWQAARQLADKKVTMWDKGWVLALMLGLLGLEWYWRRMQGLL